MDKSARGIVKPGAIAPGARKRRSGYVPTRVYYAAKPDSGRDIERTTLECYLGDKGLLVSLAFDENRLTVSA